jgi:hypothetical protein
LDDFIQKNLAALFPVYFAALWLFITTFLGFLSGWFTLANAYPDRDEEALLKLRFLSGSMGAGVSMHGILKLDVCHTGLRVGILRLFGIFERDFFVPWTEITVERRTRFFMPMADLRFGNPALGHLALYPYVADRLARAADGRWPEPGPIVAETPREALTAIVKQWALLTGLASLFFIIAPRLLSQGQVAPPIAVAILFPAIVLGIGSLVQYFQRTRR